MILNEYECDMVFILFDTVTKNEIAKQSIITQRSEQSTADQPKVKQRRVHKVRVCDEQIENQNEIVEKDEEEPFIVNHEFGISDPSELKFRYVWIEEVENID